MQTQWKAIADKQYLQSMNRIREQEIYKQKLKQAYMSQLSNQLKSNEQLKKRQKSLEKWQDKQIINNSIQDQKRIIQNQKMRLRLLNNRLEKVDQQNQIIQNKKRQQSQLIKKVQQTIQLEGTQQLRRIQQFQKQEQLKKKQEIRRKQLQQIQMVKQQKMMNEKLERYHAKSYLDQGQNRKLKQQIQRLRFYHNLRQRAEKADYGSHKAFEDKNNKTLVQRKKQQWQTYRDNIQMQQKMKQMQQKGRINRLLIQNQYRHELKRQIDERSLYNKNKNNFQTEADRRCINYSVELSQKLQNSNKEREQQQKRYLSQVLRQQAEQSAWRKQNSQQMRDHQVRLNFDILAKPTNINSLDTFHMDTYRKKQLQTIQKAMNPPRYNTIDVAQNNKLTYFANKGINLIK